MNAFKFAIVCLVMFVAGSIVALDSYCRKESAECPIELTIEDDKEQ